MRLFTPPDVRKLEAKGDVKGLIKVLSHDRDAKRREAAAWALRHLADSQCLPTLLDALRDEDENVRAIAAGGLGKLSDPSAVGPLIKALEDNARQVWLAAVESLGQLRDPRASAPLVSKLRDTDDSRVKAAVLAIGPPSVEPLIAMLEDGRAYARQEAALTLKELGDTRAVAALVALLTDREASVRTRAAEALDGLGWTPADDGEEIDYWIATQEWSKLGARAFEPLVQQLGDHDPDRRADAALTLGQLGDARAVPALLPILDDQELAVRKAAADALEALGWMPDSDETKIAFAVAQSDWDGFTRIGPGAVAPLIGLLDDRKSGHQIVRENAADALGEIGDGRAAEPLIDSLNHDDSLEVRRAAARSLVQLYQSPGLDQPTKAKILAQRDKITYREEEPDWDEERFGNPPGPWVDHSIGVAFPLEDSGPKET